jgi:hypothetical protein
LTIIAGGVAVVLLAFTVAEFTKAEPSAGSFITYVETSLGSRAGVATALLVAVGYTVAIAGVFTMSGGMLALTVAHYASWRPPWEPLTLVLTVGAVWLTAHGVSLSTAAVGVAVLVLRPTGRDIPPAADGGLGRAAPEGADADHWSSVVRLSAGVRVPSTCPLPVLRRGG